MTDKKRGMAVDEAKRPSSAMDPLFLAMSRARRRRYQESVDICTKLLESNQLDQVPHCKVDYRAFGLQA